MATKIIPKKSTVAAKVPLVADLDQGELAINLTDKKIYSKNGSNAIVEMGFDGAYGSLSGVPGTFPPTITGTSFSGTYPVLFNVTGDLLYSDTDITFTGTTGVLSVPAVDAGTGYGTGFTLEGNTHQINSNDGGGNFNIRVANDFITGCTEAGYASHWVYSQSTGVWSFNGSTATLAVGNAPTWQTNMSLDANGNLGILGTVDGRNVAVDGSKLDGIEAGATAGLPSTGTMTSLTIGAGVTLKESTDRPDLLQIESLTGTWSGMQIYNSVDNLRCSFFCDGTTAGFYDDVVNQWMCKFEAAGQVELFHANLIKFATTSTGITVTGDVNSTSDRALKENIVKLEDPIVKLRAINGYTYNFIENGERSVGVIAQEVEAILPDAVRGEEGEKTVNYNALIGLLVEVNKEQQSKIESLEARLEALEERLV